VDTQRRTHGKPVSRLPGSYTQIHARRWKRSLNPQLDPSTQGDGTSARYNRMAAGSSQSLGVPDLVDVIHSPHCELA